MPLDHTDRTSAPCSSAKGHGHENCVDVESTDWVWVPIVVVLTFLIFMLMGRKVSKFGGKSTRMKLMEYISIDPLLNTLKGETNHHLEEQRKIEYGHQGLCVGAFILLIANYAKNAGDYRWIFFVPCAVQIGLWLLNILVDIVLIKARGNYGLRSVRSVNTKLRFAHCTYQVILFCVDFLKSAGILSLPPDCYIWATTHYSYEAIGLLLEGLNVIGLSEFVIIVLVNASAMDREVDANGSLLAFGLTCILTSCLSLILAIPYKIWDSGKLMANPEINEWKDEDDESDEEKDGKEKSGSHSGNGSGHAHKSSSTPHHHVVSLNAEKTSEPPASHRSQPVSMKSDHPATKREESSSAVSNTGTTASMEMHLLDTKVQTYGEQ
jgi:hypothetical protein